MDALVSYEALNEQDVIDFENKWINLVTEETLIEVKATILIGELQKEVLFMRTITPVYELVITSISEALLTTEMVTVEASVIGVIDSSETNFYNLILKDDTGVIEIELDYQTYQAYNDYGTSGYISNVLRVTGRTNQSLGTHLFEVMSITPVFWWSKTTNRDCKSFSVKTKVCGL